MQAARDYVLGAGFTGLAAGMTSGLPVLEARAFPGGICASYYQDGFRFEVGGGHWIFAADETVRPIITRAVPCREYSRRSAVYFAGGLPATASLAGSLVPYPIQFNLWALPESIRRKAVLDLSRTSPRDTDTMAGWLENTFGAELYRIFFEPFHERYTAGLFRRIAPQDAYKTPVDMQAVLRGLTGRHDETGYNARFLYPEAGLDALALSMAASCRIEYGCAVCDIDLRERFLILANGSRRPYGALISTLPLDQMVNLTGLGEGVADPSTSVLVFNLGVRTPDTAASRHGYQWLYVPDSRSGFHRIGYYSNVDRHFIPARWREDPFVESLYVELAFPAGSRLDAGEREGRLRVVVEELESLGLISGVVTADSTWIETAYTWQLPGSRWVSDSIARLEGHGIAQIGRYARWTFHGISKSIRDGMAAGSRHVHA